MSDVYKIILSLSPALFIFIYFYFTDKLGGMDFFKEKCTFEEAIKALKDGHTIRRFKDYKIFTSAFTTIEGKTTQQFGRIDKEKKFSPGISFYEEDILSNEWIIENKKENK